MLKVNNIIPELDNSQDDEDLNEYTKSILRQFCAYEKINYPKTVALFKKQTEEDKLDHIRWMRDVVNKRKLEKSLSDSISKNSSSTNTGK